MPAHILFDLDGTLTDPKDGITRSIRFALTRLGAQAPAEELLTWCIGPSLRASFGRLLQTTDESLIEHALSIYRERFGQIGLYENRLYPGVLSALDRIRQSGVGVFLATAKPLVFAARILDHFGMTPFFNGIYGSELDGRLSDKKDLIAHILDRENLVPGATLMVGDRAQDITGGQNNGTLTAWVSYGYGCRDEIINTGPDHIFDTIQDLTAFVQARALSNADLWMDNSKLLKR